jgi:glyoxylase-like metal-dependent hydrolase (beta-lactamase superfamily II)
LTIQAVTATELAAHRIVRIRADNPGPFTLGGTNTWIVGADPAWLVDPGPALDDHHAAIVAELERRGGLGGVALTHDHRDHAEGVAAIRERFDGAPLAAGRGPADVRLADGATFGPLRAVATPGHAPDHFAFVCGRAALTGDAVLGEGSVFIAPDPGALSGYLDGLHRLRALDLELLAPGHGPIVTEPRAKLDEYIAHRLDRERRLLAALDDGARGTDELLDAGWAEVPEVLRPAAAVTLLAHLDKLADEGRLPYGVQRPRIDAAALSEPHS